MPLYKIEYIFAMAFETRIDWYMHLYKKVNFIELISSWAKKQFVKRCQCCACIPFLRRMLDEGTKPMSEKTLVEIESEKPPLGNFTMSEYTEKVIQYGLMMVGLLDS